MTIFIPISKRIICYSQDYFLYGIKHFKLDDKFLIIIMRELETIRLMEDEIQNIINQNKNDSDFKNEDDGNIFI